VRSKRVIPLGTLNRVALRDDAPARSRFEVVAMVQHGRFPERDPMSARSEMSHLEIRPVSPHLHVSMVEFQSCDRMALVSSRPSRLFLLLS
jgi:hypothetical protein